jgi:hypothetical protein
MSENAQFLAASETNALGRLAFLAKLCAERARPTRGDERIARTTLKSQSAGQAREQEPCGSARGEVYERPPRSIVRTCCRTPAGQGLSDGDRTARPASISVGEAVGGAKLGRTRGEARGLFAPSSAALCAPGHLALRGIALLAQ